MKRLNFRLFLVLFIFLGAMAACDSSQLLEPGAKAPSVTLQDQNGTPLDLASFRGQPLLIYFYPKDATPGCTTEACSFRDVWESYEQARVAVVGVSIDDVASHKEFADEHSLPFPLLADTQAELAAAFGIEKRMGMLPRVSFLIDAEGVIRAVYPDVDPGLHAAEVLKDVERLNLG